jgi:putative membrane protein
MMWGFGSGAGWLMWLSMTIGVVGFWVIVALVIRALWRGNRGVGEVAAARPDPLTLLQEGLARGDISPEQYEQRRRILIDGH